MTASEAEKDTEQSTIVIDPYRVKLRGRPGDLGEDPPVSWREVVGQVNRHLMRIAAAPTRLISEVLEGATRLVRGLTRLPESISRRIERSHAGADSQESLSQQLSDFDRALSHEDASTSVERIEIILTKYRVHGFFAELTHDSDGRPILLLVKPEDVGLLGELVRGALPPSSEESAGKNDSPLPNGSA